MKCSYLNRGLLFGLSSFLAISFYSQAQETDTPIDCELEANRDLAECVDASGEVVVDEIVVTGTYLQRDKFTSPSPIEVITNADIEDSGALTIGEYIRDANFSLNADLLDQGGDTVLNIRGFGTDGTTTLINGVRATTALDGNSLIPDIALERAEVLLDGGGALYGADAIAGVINLIPIDKFEGVRFRGRYHTDASDYNDSSISALYGKAFDFLNLNFTQSFEVQDRSTLSRTERPQYIRASPDIEGAGNPAIWSGVVDPDCGRDILSGDLSHADPGVAGFAPFGFPLNSSREIASDYNDIATCEFGVSEQQDYFPRLERYVSRSNFRMDITDYLEVNYSFTGSYREVNNRDDYGAGRSDLLSLPCDHPAVQATTAFNGVCTPGGFLTSTGFRAFGKIGTNPSGYNSDGSYTRDEETRQYNHTVEFDYDFGNTEWGGHTYGSTSSRTVTREFNVLRTSRLSAGLFGLGGPNCAFDSDSLIGLTRTQAQTAATNSGITPGQNGCQYFNPLASNALNPALANSQELVNWMTTDLRWKDVRTETRTYETRVQGPLFELWAGPVEMVLGFNYRHVTFATLNSSLEDSGDVYYQTGTSFIFDEEVRSPFAEVAIPLLDNLSVSYALRIEEYADRPFGEAKVPKISISYQPIEDLALRASVGESFTAPRAQQLNEGQLQNRAFFVRFINDPFAQENGGNAAIMDPTPGTIDYFANGNASLAPETTDTINIGFTYRGLEDWTFSADFQEIEYHDYIRELTVTQASNRQYDRFIAAGGDINNFAQVLAFLNANPAANYTRDPNTGIINDVLVRPTNADEDIVARFVDLRIGNTLDTGIGYFNTVLSATAYSSYNYVDVAVTDGTTTDVVGRRNAEIGEAVALPRWKGNLRLTWRSGDHSIVSSTNYVKGVLFDGNLDLVPNAADVPEEIDDFLTVDLRYTYSMAELYGGSARLTFGAINLFDEEAQPLPVTGGIDSALHDPLGRRVFVEMNYEF